MGLLASFCFVYNLCRISRRFIRSEQKMCILNTKPVVDGRYKFEFANKILPLYNK